MLSKQAIEEYRKIMKEEYGQEISYVEGEEQGIRLLRFFQLLIKTDRKEKQTSKK